MNKTINLYVDMDGTLAKFYYKKNCLEKMYEKGYFETLPAYAIASKVDELAKQDTCVNVYILSACVDTPYCEQEKMAWLFNNMPNIPKENFIFTKVGQDKVKVAKEKVANFGQYVNVLLDDYTPNLEQWQNENNCVALKFINGFNDTTKTWQGKKIQNFAQLLATLEQLAMYGRVE